MLIIKLDNYSEIKEEFGEEKVQKIILKILGTFKNVIRVEDFVTPRGEMRLLY